MRGREKNKDEMVAEYLAGEASYAEMEMRYGVAAVTLHRWVKAARVEAKRAEQAGRTGEKESGGGGERGDERRGQDLTTEVKRQRIELGKARLHNKFLNTMIDIAEEEFEIPIRKKRGARQ